MMILVMAGCEAAEQLIDVVLHRRTCWTIRLPEPFQMRYTRNNLWELHYREHVIKERIKAVLAGYVVAIRAFAR